MCYFSDEDERKKLKGRLSKDELSSIANIFYPKALQVVVGCGAEPTVYKDFIDLIEDAKEYNVPNVSMVTNGMLLTESDIVKISELKLDELILSMHGVTKSVYEEFMVNADYSKFVDNFNILKQVRSKSKYPKVRINYTVNDENLEDLSLFFEEFGDFPIDTIQLRPVRSIGGEYSNSIRDNQVGDYNEMIRMFAEESKKRGISLLANTIDLKYEKTNESSSVIEAIYTYIGPNTAKQIGSNWEELSFRKYIKKIGWRSKVLRRILGIKSSNKSTDDFLKYEILD
ncbi:MAG: radical SAM protein [Flavobacteriales bacterium]|nr:radical SAM protein [Flavobacteriales bacterium]